MNEDEIMRNGADEQVPADPTEEAVDAMADAMMEEPAAEQAAAPQNPEAVPQTPVAQSISETVQQENINVPVYGPRTMYSSQQAYRAQYGSDRAESAQERTSRASQESREGYAQQGRPAGYGQPAGPAAGTGQRNYTGQNAGTYGYQAQQHTPVSRAAAPERKSGRGGIVAAILIGALVFGTAIGGSFAGVSYILNRGVSRTAGTEAAAETTAAAETQAALVQVPETSAAPTAAAAENGSGPQVMITDVSDLVEEAMPALVAIDSKMTVTQNTLFFGPQSFQASGSGSGIIAGKNDEELLLITNNHVVNGSDELEITFMDGGKAPAAIKGTDPDSDLAVVAVKLSDIPSETMSTIKIAKLGDSDKLELGQGVVAIGNALGEGQTVTVGVVSALNKNVTIENVTRTLLQVDAPINPGNSGGALLNMYGEVIGINSAKLADTKVEGVGYAIPITYAKKIVDELMTRETRTMVEEDEQGYLGIQLQNIDSNIARMYGMPQGIYVYKIVEGSAAAASDLQEKDIITKVDGQTVKTGEELQKLLKTYRGGTEVTLTVETQLDGSYEEREVKVVLGFRRDAKNSIGQSGQESKEN